jgi:hypothetical protein
VNKIAGVKKEEKFDKDDVVNVRRRLGEEFSVKKKAYIY